MNGLLLDTHVWLWHLYDDPKLPLSLSEEIEASAQDVWLSPVSVWELGLLHRRGRIDLDIPLRGWIDRAVSILALRDAALTREVALVADEVELPVQDPADRFIAATAIVYDLTLLTADRHMVAAGLRTRSPCPGAQRRNT